MRSETQRSWLGWAIGALLAALLVWRLKDVLAPVLAALLWAYLTDPMVTWLSRRIPRAVSAGVAVVLLVAVVLGLMLVILPLLIHELGVFAERVPGYSSQLWGAVVPAIAGRLPFVPTTASEIGALLSTHAQDLASHLAGPLRDAVTGVFSGIGGFVSFVLKLVTVPVFVYFLSRAWPSGVAFCRELVPPNVRGRAEDIVRQIDQGVAGWLRGQLTVMVILAALYAIGLSLVGIEFSVLIGILTGMLAFVPFVGAALGVSLALLTALVDFAGWGQVLGVLGCFAVVQALDAVLITPKLVGGRSGLGPLGVILALMLGGELLGFVGVMLAVPLAVVLVILAKEALATYRQSAWFE